MNPATLSSVSNPHPDMAISDLTRFPTTANERPVPQITIVEPVRFEKRGEIYFADFGKAAWGNLQITFDETPDSNLTVRLGEKLNDDGNIDHEPPGSVNFREIVLMPRADQKTYQLDIPSHWMHEDEMAVGMPHEIGEVTPFRYVEIESEDESPAISVVHQLFVHTAFDDDAAGFECSDPTLKAVWELCKYTMKATTAFGVYIDGERERIPYEADAYINQLSHLACDFNPAVAQASFEHLLKNPTWPTEWSFHTVMMAAADYEATGDISLAARHYAALKEKLLMDKAREDGLLRVGANIDWPPCERDGYNNGEVFPNDPDGQMGPEINAVANAFYFHALERMALIASALHEAADAKHLQEKSRQVFDSFNRHLFDAARGIYIDGVNDENERSSHASLHANMFALAFGLVPPEKQSSVADYVESRGMACSVYGAQYLLEALFRAGRDEAALRLLTSREERSWWHMIELGSTMTLEAWDVKYKSNLTWNHAWGAAPANLISRFVLGVRPLSPGYQTIIIAPQPGTLEWAVGEVPTPLGPVKVSFRNGETFTLEITVPQGVTAQVKWPRSTASQVRHNGVFLPVRDGDNMIINGFTQGQHHFSA